MEGMETAIETQPAPESPSAPSPAAPETSQAPKESASSAYSAIAKEKKRALMIQRQLKAEREAIAKERQDIESYRTQMTAAKKDPIAALQAAGFSYKDATDFMLNNQEMTPQQQVKAVQEEIQNLKKEREQEKEQLTLQQKETAEREYRESIDQYNEFVTGYIQANAEKLELSAQRPEEAAGMIVETVKEHWNREWAKYKANPDGPKPRAMSHEEAADLVEGYYEEQAMALAKTKKIQSRLAPKPAEQNPPAPGGKTLSNNLTSSMSTSLPAKTEAERIQRALAALEKR